MTLDMEVQKDSRLLKILLILAGLLVVLVLATTLLKPNHGDSGMSLVADDKYQAVFLNNGEVYFGKITDNNKHSLVLEDIYYLRVTPTLQQSPDGTAVQDPNQQPQINLIKLGEELHGPEDRMVVPQSSIVYWENIEADGQVSQAIITAKEQGDRATENQAPALQQPVAQPQPASTDPAATIPVDGDAAVAPEN